MKNKRCKKYAPLRSFTWSKDSNVSADQKLIESTITEWYEAKHPKASFEEIEFINSIPMNCCPSCGSTVYDNRNFPTTSKYWLIKVFEILKDIQDDVKLDGKVYLDETYFTKVKSKTITKDGKKLRGISRNKIGVGVACNDKASIFIVTNTSKPSKESTKRTYEKYIVKGATLIHDDEKSHNVLIEYLELKDESYSSLELKK